MAGKELVVDTALANLYSAKAKEFDLEAKYDSSIFYHDMAVKIYESSLNWDLAIKEKLFIADLYRYQKRLDYAEGILKECLMIVNEGKVEEVIKAELFYSYGKYYSTKKKYKEAEK